MCLFTICYDAEKTNAALYLMLYYNKDTEAT